MANVEIESLGAREPRPNIVHDNFKKVSSCRRLVFGVHGCRLSRHGHAKVIEEVMIDQWANQTLKSAGLFGSLESSNDLSSRHMQLSLGAYLPYPNGKSGVAY